MRKRNDTINLVNAAGEVVRKLELRKPAKRKVKAWVFYAEALGDGTPRLATASFSRAQARQSAGIYSKFVRRFRVTLDE